MWRKHVKVGHGTLFRGASGRWNLNITVRGKDKCYAMGTKDMDEAERKRKETVDGIRQGVIDELSRIPLLGAWSLFESSPAAARIVGEGMETRFRAWMGFASWMRDRHPDISDISGIDRATVNEYIDFYSEGHTAMTTNKTVFHLRGMMDVMGIASGSRFNPFDHVRQLPWDSHPRRSLGRDEIARLLKAAKDEGGDYHLLFLVAAYTGQRLGECCRLKWEDIDIERGVIQLVPSKTRKYANGQLVTIPIHWKLMQALLEIPAGSRVGPVMPTLARSYASNRWCAKGALARIFKAAGIATSVKLADRKWSCPEASFHSLRHSFVSFAANSGVPLEFLRSIVGHKTTAMTRHYYHADEDGLRMAVAAIPAYDASGNMVQGTVEPLFVSRAERENEQSQRMREVEALFEEGLISETECNEACMKIAAESR